MAPKNVTVDVEAFRRSAGISQNDLADLAGMPRTTLRRKIKKPGTFTIDEFAVIAKALNIPISEALVA